MLGNPIVEQLLREMRSGLNPLVDIENEAALETAICDELGRGTNPAKLKKRLLDCMVEKETPLHRAA